VISGDPVVRRKKKIQEDFYGLVPSPSAERNLIPVYHNPAFSDKISPYTLLVFALNRGRFLLAGAIVFA